MSELQFGRWVPRRTDTQQIRDLVARRNALAFGDLGVGDLLIEGHFDDRFTAEVERHRKVLRLARQGQGRRTPRWQGTDGRQAPG